MMRTREYGSVGVYHVQNLMFFYIPVKFCVDLPKMIRVYDPSFTVNEVKNLYTLPPMLYD